jgi:uncharacterized protein YcgI (DUF1989 family)
MGNDVAPSPAYFPTHADSPLHPPKALYTKLRELEERDLVKTQDFLIPPRSGKAWKVGKGQIWRLSTPVGPQVSAIVVIESEEEGSQLMGAWYHSVKTSMDVQVVLIRNIKVGDLNIWNQHDPRERFWAARTRQLQGSHMVEGDRLWSNLPFMRPLCGIIKDGCLLKDGPGNGHNGGREESSDERGALTKFGGRCHDLLGTRCDPYGNILPTLPTQTTRPNHHVVSHMLTSTSYDFHCHSNLVRSVLPHGLTELDVHDVLNVFQVTGLDAQGRYFMEASPATPTSYLTFFAEQDLLCALSTCPGGDLSAWGWHQSTEGEEGGEKKDMKSTCRPIRVEVWEIREEVKKEVLAGWKSPERSGYNGGHGMSIPEGEK